MYEMENNITKQRVNITEQMVLHIYISSVAFYDVFGRYKLQGQQCFVRIQLKSKHDLLIIN